MGAVRQIKVQYSEGGRGFALQCFSHFIRTLISRVSIFLYFEINGATGVGGGVQVFQKGSLYFSTLLKNEFQKVNIFLKKLVPGVHFRGSPNLM